MTEDWIDFNKVIEDDDPFTNGTIKALVTDDNKYLSYRFNKLDIESVTLENYQTKLVPSLAKQVEDFLPPIGSFEAADLRRYLELVRSYETSSNDIILGFSLADQIRIAFSDMDSATICEKFTDIDLPTKRRYRCVAEYLLRQEELIKIRDEKGKLVKKLGNMNKLVVIYQPLPKIRETLKRSGLSAYIRYSKEELEQQKLQAPVA
jgi:hypothetical protein